MHTPNPTTPALPERLTDDCHGDGQGGRYYALELPHTPGGPIGARIVVDTLNCDSIFDEQQQMEIIAALRESYNTHAALVAERDALRGLLWRAYEVIRDNEAERDAGGRDCYDDHAGMLLAEIETAFTQEPARD